MAVRAPTPILAKINPSLSSRSLIKNMCIVSGASMLGDLGCQKLESLTGDIALKVDFPRTMRMGVTGAFVLAPMSLAWNVCAERIAPGKSFQAVMMKLGIMMSVAPLLICTQFATLTLLEEGKTLEDVRCKLSRDLKPTLMNASWFWPMVSVTNTLFVPVINRPAASSFAGLFWNMYLSYQANHNGVEMGEVSEVFAVKEARSVAENAAMLPAEREVTVVREKLGDDHSQVNMSEKEREAGEKADAGKGVSRSKEAQGGAKKGRIVRKTSVVSM